MRFAFSRSDALPVLRLAVFALLLFALLGAERATAGSVGSDAAFAGAPSRSILQGTFVGALLTGQPYEKAGLLDFAAAGLLGLAIVQFVSYRARKRKEREDQRRFSAHHHTPSQTEEDGRDRESASRHVLSDNRPSDARDDGGVSGGNKSLPPAWRNKRPAAKGWGVPSVNDKEPEQSAKPLHDIADQAEAMWASVSSRQSASAGKLSNDGPAASGGQIPVDFDLADFLEGARTLYIRLQKAWAARKLAELAPFLMPDLLEVLQEQAARHPHTESVEILHLNAVLLHLQRSDAEERADVAFSALLSVSGAAPDDIRETWRFARNRQGDGMWRLVAIEQGEAQ